MPSEPLMDVLRYLRGAQGAQGRMETSCGVRTVEGNRPQYVAVRCAQVHFPHTYLQSVNGTVEAVAACVDRMLFPWNFRMFFNALKDFTPKPMGHIHLPITFHLLPLHFRQSRLGP